MVIAGVTRLFLIRRGLIDIQFLHILNSILTLSFCTRYIGGHLG